MLRFNGLRRATSLVVAETKSLPSKHHLKHASSITNVNSIVGPSLSFSPLSSSNSLSRFVSSSSASSGLPISFLSRRQNLIASTLRQPSRRSSFLNRIRDDITAATVDDVLSDKLDVKSKVDYVKKVASMSPSNAIRIIEKGWERGKIPVSEEVVKEYFKCIAAMKKFDSVNLLALLEILQKANAFGSEAVLSQLKGVNPSFTFASLGGVGGGIRTAAGSSPMEPLFIQTAEPNWKSQVMKMLKFTVATFLLLSFAGAILDERGGAGGISSRLGMGSAIHQAEHSDKTFDDVVGIDEAKAELQEIVLYLKDPRRFTRLGGKLPKGVLLTGPPGTGKTLLARAIAGEAGVPFFYTSGSEFDEMYVGVGARRVRDLFAAAKAKSPCIIFIDEIDAIGGTRSVKEQSAMKMTLNQLLVEMDGFEQNSGVIVIAATNFPDSLDTALTRPGRLDKHVDVPTPDIGGRKAILELYGKRVPLGPDVNLEQIARGTPGFSGAELYNLVNQAALKASVDGLKSVGMAALEYAKDKIMMGSERKSAVISPETMKMTAFHEAGHALVALKTDGADPIHKATIMPRGRALGMVMQLPDGDQTSYSRKQMLARLDVCMGGRVAEELVYGAENVTSGASSDIQQATRLANAMVTKYGLSEKVGVMFLDDKNKGSGETQKFVDDEVRALLTESYNRAKKILETNRKDLDIIAKGLLEYESLSGGEIVSLLKGVAPSVKLRSQAPSRSTKPLPGSPASTSPSPVASVAANNNNVNKNVTSQVMPPSAQKQSAPSPSPSTPTSTASAASTTSPASSTPSTNPTPAATTSSRGPPKA